MPRSRYCFLGDDAPYFMTMTVNYWLPVFTRPDTAEILFDSWRYLQNRHDLRIHGYVVLETHLHVVAGSQQIGKDVQRFKSYTARRILDHLEEVGAHRLLELFARTLKIGDTREAALRMPGSQAKPGNLNNH